MADRSSGQATPNDDDEYRDDEDGEDEDEVDVNSFLESIGLERPAINLNYADFADYQQWKLNQVKREVGIARRERDRVWDALDIIEAIVGGPSSKGISDQSVRKHIDMGEHFSWDFYQEREE